jgi:hypothetical protein
LLLSEISATAPKSTYAMRPAPQHIGRYFRPRSKEAERQRSREASLELLLSCWADACKLTVRHGEDVAGVRVAVEKPELE